MAIEKKTCLNCGEPIKGRADKKFCDDACRNNYNNQLNSDNTNYVRNINNILRKNRRILEDFIPSDKTTAKASKKKLDEAGFSFSNFTSIYKNKQNQTYFFNYEYGYLLLENDWYMIVKKDLDKE
jgi:predicted nucleic acid-binding Zn ribbon protein